MSPVSTETRPHQYHALLASAGTIAERPDLLREYALGRVANPSTAPTGLANFADDVAIRRYADQLNTIVHWSEFDTGSHFAAMDTPTSWLAMSGQLLPVTEVMIKGLS